LQPNFFERVYRLVCCVPRGQVASYGQIAALLGHPRAARTVGWALNALTEEQAQTVPWHRIINSAGGISTIRIDLDAALQQRLLEEEGIVFDASGHVDMSRFRWAGLDPVEVEEIVTRDT